MRIIRIPHSGHGLVDYKNEDRALFSNVTQIEGSADFSARYFGNSGEDVWESYTPPAPALPNYGTKITRLALKLRMTALERKSIRLAAESNDDVYDFMDLLSDSTYIDLERAETVQGITLLEQASLLGEGRASTILGARVTQEEVYKN